MLSDLAGLDWDARPDEGLAGAAMASAGRMAAVRRARARSFILISLCGRWGWAHEVSGSL